MTDFEERQFIEFNSTRNMHAVKVTDNKITFNYSRLVRNKTKLQILARHNEIFKGIFFFRSLKSQEMFEEIMPPGALFKMVAYIQQKYFKHSIRPLNSDLSSIWVKTTITVLV